MRLIAFEIVAFDAKPDIDAEAIDKVIESKSRDGAIFIVFSFWRNYIGNFVYFLAITWNQRTLLNSSSFQRTCQIQPRLVGYFRIGQAG